MVVRLEPSNPPAQSLTHTSTAPSAEVSSGSAATGTQTAGVSGNDYTQIPKGKQNPAREG